MNRCAWPSDSTKCEKPWGHEISWAGIFHGKEIFIKSGNRTSLKFNEQKSEMLYVQSGKVRAEYADEGHFRDATGYPSRVKVLRPGDCLNIHAGCPYRLSALEDSTVFEISDNVSSPQKVIIEDDYGRDTSRAKNQKLIFNSSAEY
jgi:mannose-6-phosphate isomerase-like protein (cupin superfamily)